MRLQSNAWEYSDHFNGTFHFQKSNPLILKYYFSFVAINWMCAPQAIRAVFYGFHTGFVGCAFMSLPGLLSLVSSWEKTAWGANIFTDLTRLIKGLLRPSCRVGEAERQTEAASVSFVSFVSRGSGCVFQANKAIKLISVQRKRGTWTQNVAFFYSIRKTEGRLSFLSWHFESLLCLFIGLCSKAGITAGTRQTAETQPQRDFHLTLKLLFSAGNAVKEQVTL